MTEMELIDVLYECGLSAGECPEEGDGGTWEIFRGKIAKALLARVLIVNKPVHGFPPDSEEEEDVDGS